MWCIAFGSDIQSYAGVSMAHTLHSSNERVLTWSSCDRNNVDTSQP